MGINVKILEIQKTVEVEKTGWDDRNEYAYFKADDVLNAIRAKLNELGIITRSRILKWEQENFYDSNGRGRPRTTAEVEVVYIDVETGEEYPTSVIATGSDIGGDKGPRKVATQAKKISLIDTFLITEESGKFDSDNDPEQEPANMQAPVEQPEAGPSLPELTAEIGDLINSGTTDGPTVGKIGNRIAKELGVAEDQKVWRRDINVIAGVHKAILAGEVE